MKAKKREILKKVSLFYIRTYTNTGKFLYICISKKISKIAGQYFAMRNGLYTLYFFAFNTNKSTERSEIQ